MVSQTVSGDSVSTAMAIDLLLCPVCGIEIPETRLLCEVHWKLVPRYLKRDIFKAVMADDEDAAVVAVKEVTRIVRGMYRP
jgi:hypothetical protein